MKLKYLIAIALVMAGTSCSKNEDEFDERPVKPEPIVTPATPEEPQKPEEEPQNPEEEPPVADSKRSPETEKLFDYLKSIYGTKTLSAACANVNWNTNEAQWVYKHTGKWPAINCFDLIHLPFSQPGGWIDYSNIKVVEDWHNAGGDDLQWHYGFNATIGAVTVDALSGVDSEDALRFVELDEYV